MSWFDKPTTFAGQLALSESIEAIIDRVDLLSTSTVRKTASETVNNTTTLQNDDELKWYVDASLSYSFEIHVFYFSGTTPDMKFAWTYPTGTTMAWGGTYYDAAAAVTTNGNFSQTTVLAVGGTGGDAHAALYGTVTVGTVAGLLQLQWAQNTLNASNTTVYLGTYGTVLPL